MLYISIGQCKILIRKDSWTFDSVIPVLARVGGMPMGYVPLFCSQCVQLNTKYFPIP